MSRVTSSRGREQHLGRQGADDKKVADRGTFQGHKSRQQTVSRCYMGCHACLHTAMRTRVPTSLNLKFQEDATERVMNCVCVCHSFPTHLTLFSPVTERLVCHLGIISLCHLRLTTGCRAAVPAIVVLHCIQGWGLGFGGLVGS